MFMLISNKPIKVAQSINGEWHTCDKNGNNSLSKSKKNFGHLMKRGTERFNRKKIKQNYGQ